MVTESPLAIARSIVDAGVDCVVIGGHAVNFHGYPRSTQDVDLIFRRGDNGDVKLHETLIELGAFWIGDEIDPTTGIEIAIPVSLDYIANHHLMMLGTRHGYLDLFDFIPGMPAEPLDDLFATAQKSGTLRFVSLSWLRKMKLAAGRPQDLIDLEHLPSGG